MNSPEHSLTIAVAAVVCLLWLWLVAFKRLRRDDFRADIRKIRDDLFDFMTANKLPMNDAGYTDARDNLNGLLRWSVNLNPLTFMISLAVVTRSEQLSSEPTRSTNQKLTAEIEKQTSLAVRRTIRFLFLEGTTGLFVRCVLIIVRCLRLAKKTQAIVKTNTAKALNNTKAIGTAVSFDRLKQAREAILRNHVRGSASAP